MTTARLRNAARERAASVLLLVAAVAVLAACHSAVSPLFAGTRLALGTWGGDNVGLIETDSVTHVHVGCTFGDFPANVALDVNGRFTIDGSYMLHAYPIAFGPSMPAELSGQVVGTTLTFAIAVNDTVAKKVVALGPGTVVLGREPTMGVCPICRVPNRDRVSLLARSRGPNVDPPHKAHR